MAFKKFIPKKVIRKRPSMKPMLTVYKTQDFAVSAAAVQEFGLQDCQAVVLYWDRKRRAVGIEIANGEHSVKTKHYKGTMRIKSRAFVRQTGITETRRAELSRDAESGFLVAVFGP